MTTSILRESSQTTLAERHLLLDAVEQLAPGSRIVEIGTADGGTTRILADAARARRAQVTTVDLATPDALADSLRDLGVRCVRASSHDPETYWPGEERVDMLFVDGDHSWFGVRNDWEAWRTRLAPNAIVLFHDVSPCCPGEFVYVLDRIAHGELADPVSQDTITGGRFVGIVEDRALTRDGAALLRRTIEAPLELWPTSLVRASGASRRKLDARPINGDDRTITCFDALDLRPTPSGPAIIDGVGRAIRAFDSSTIVVDRLLRERLPMRLFETRDPRFFDLFASELRTSIEEITANWDEARRAFVASCGLHGRCPLFDFVDPRNIEKLLVTDVTRTATLAHT